VVTKKSRIRFRTVCSYVSVVYFSLRSRASDDDAV